MTNLIIHSISSKIKAKTREKMLRKRNLLACADMYETEDALLKDLFDVGQRKTAEFDTLCNPPMVI